MSQPEVELVRRARAGDREALSDLLARHGGQCEARIAARINPKWRSVLEATDVMQVTYIEAFREIGNLESDEPTRFVAWLKRSAENNLQDAIRGLQAEKRPQPDRHQRPADGEDPITFLQDYLAGAITTPSGRASRREIRALLESYVAKLPEDYAEVLSLFFLEGQSGADVAAKLGRRRGAVFMLRARALQALRKEIGSGSAFFTT